MSTPLRDPELLTLLLGRPVIAVEQETAMGMQRVLALHFAGGSVGGAEGGAESVLRFPLPTGNALKTAGEVAEIRALLSGLSRQVAAAIRRRVGTGEPTAAADSIDATVMAALTDPDAFIDDQDPAGFPLARP